MFFSQPLHFVTHTLTNLIPLMPYTPSLSSNGPYSSVLGIHFTIRVAPTMVRREHNRVPKFQVDTDGEKENTTPLSLARKEWLWYHKGRKGTQRWKQEHSYIVIFLVEIFPTPLKYSFTLPTMCPLPPSLYNFGGANDGKKGTQQQSTKVSGRHRERDREHNTTITGQKRVALIPYRGHNIGSKSTVI